jgi:acyl dehydratase
MAVRGIYTKEEKKMLAELEEAADKLTGWGKSINPVATAESIKNYGYYTDRWNPIWRDDNYAKNTRWGSILAFPTYEYHFGGFMWTPKAPADGSFVYESYIGEDWELFKPVRPGDSIRCWNRRPRFEDITSLDGKGLRKFAAFARDADYINQKDELISTLKLYLEQTIYPAYPKPYAMPEYGYTKEELKYIDRLAREEEIRGAKIRYWEDVSVGEVLRPAVLGPTSIEYSALSMSTMPRGDSPIPPREVLRESEMAQAGEDFLPGPVEGLLYTHGGRHFSDRAAQAQAEPLAWLFGATSKIAMTRCVTNWMGDDGFIRKLRWRHIARIAIGDTIIDTGRVTDKRVENGEHLVDLLVWGRNMRGNITEVATFTVSLLSKETPGPFKGE